MTTLKQYISGRTREVLGKMKGAGVVLLPLATGDPTLLPAGDLLKSLNLQLAVLNSCFNLLSRADEP